MGVIVFETEFATVSEWMLHGNISQFVEGHQGADRFELVGFLSNLLQSAPVADCGNCAAPTAEGCRPGLDLHAQSRDNPWKP